MASKPKGQTSGSDDLAIRAAAHLVDVVKAAAGQASASLQPRHPAGAPGGKGGEFAPKGTTGGSGARANDDRVISTTVSAPANFPRAPNVSHLTDNSSTRSYRNRLSALERLAAARDVAAIQSFPTSMTNSYHRGVSAYRDTLLAHFDPAARQAVLRGTMPPPPTITGSNPNNSALVSAQRHIERMTSIANTSPDPLAALQNYQAGSGAARTNSYLQQAISYRTALIAHLSQGEAAASAPLLPSTRPTASAAAPAAAPAATLGALRAAEDRASVRMYDARALTARVERNGVAVAATGTRREIDAQHRELTSARQAQQSAERAYTDAVLARAGADNAARAAAPAPAAAAAPSATISSLNAAEDRALARLQDARSAVSRSELNARTAAGQNIPSVNRMHDRQVAGARQALRSAERAYTDAVLERARAQNAAGATGTAAGAGVGADQRQIAGEQVARNAEFSRAARAETDRALGVLQAARSEHKAARLNARRAEFSASRDRDAHLAAQARFRTARAKLADATVAFNAAQANESTASRAVANLAAPGGVADPTQRGAAASASVGGDRADQLLSRVHETRAVLDTALTNVRAADNRVANASPGADYNAARIAQNAVEHELASAQRAAGAASAAYNAHLTGSTLDPVPVATSTRPAAATPTGPRALSAITADPALAANPRGLTSDQLGFVPRPNVPLTSTVHAEGIRTSGRTVPFASPEHEKLARAYLAQPTDRQSRARAYQEGRYQPPTPQTPEQIAATRAEAKRSAKIHQARMQTAAADEERARASIPEIYRPRNTPGANITQREDQIRGTLSTSLPAVLSTSDGRNRLSDRMVVDYTSGVTFKTSWSGSGSALTATFTGNDGTNMQRRFSVDQNGETSVYHAFFRAGRTGGGGGKQFFRTAMGEYIAAGVKHVDVSANIDVGGYAWARYGYLPKAQSDWDHLRSNLKAKLERMNVPAPVKTAALKVLNNSDKKSLWALADMKVGDTPIGKNLLMNSSWSGRIDTSNRVQMQRFTAYVSQE
jgi:hypothetical protein